MRTLAAFLCLLPWLTLAQVPTMPGGAVPWFKLKSASGELQVPVANLAYWWVAYDLATNATVTGWTDRVNGLVFKNDNSGKRPSTTVDGVSFNGSTELTNTGFLPEDTNGFFIILKRTSQGEWNAFDTDYLFRKYSVYSCDLICYQTPIIKAGGVNSTLPTNSWITFGWTYDANNALYYTNGVDTGTHPLKSSLAATTTAARRVIGGRNDGSIYFTGYIREYLGFTNRLTATDMSNLYWYASTKYSGSWP